MFKKPVKISAQNQLSGKDRKTMKNKLSQNFDEACVDKILAENDKIISCKISGNKMIIYNGNDYPLFVDESGKNDYFPSLYTVIAYQPLVKVVDINEGVEAYIYNGANLMWPGVRDYSSLGQFQKGQVVGIRSAKGQIIAIGALGCSLKQLKTGSDNSGIAVTIFHFYNDKLWELGPKTKPQVIIKAQKIKPKQQQPQKQQSKTELKEQKVPKQKQQQVVEQKTKQKKTQIQKAQQKQQKGKQKPKKKESSEQKPKRQKSQQKQQSDDEVDFGNLVHTKKPKPTHAQPIKIQKKKQDKADFSDEQQNQKKNKKKQAKKQNKKKGKKQSDHQQKQKNEEQGQQDQQNKQHVQQQKSVVSTKLMDQQFKQAFLNTLKLSKVQGELPIDSGRFYMDFMLLARPEGTKLEIKDTSYKKLGKFYQQMSKLKFIEFKHNKDKKGQQGSSIVKILWQNQQLKNYEPTIMKMNQKDVQQKEQVSNSKKKLKLSQTLEVKTVFKMHQNLKNAIYSKKVNYAPTQQQQKQMKKQQQQIQNLPQYYTQSQIKVLIEKYINDKLVPKRQKGKKQDKKQDKQQDKQQDKKQDKKQDKQKKKQKMITIDYKNNKYLTELLKKQIQQFEQNVEADKNQSGDQEEETKGKKKKQKVMKMERGALLNKIFRTCSSSYQIRDPSTGLQGFHEGTFKGIQLVAEKSNNKNITKIIGLENFIVPKQETQQQINGFANTLKQKFASSVNVLNLPGKNAGKQIIVHGNFINQLQQIFTQQYKINEQYITTQNKLDKKKKR